MAVIAYARVSTTKQDTHLQIDAFAAAGIQDVRWEKAGSVATRPVLFETIAGLQAGDVLAVWKIDRIARSLLDLLQILERVHKVGATFRSLTEPYDTSGHVGTLLLHVTGAFAQYERSIIRERSMAGQVAAIKRGVQFGRPKKLTPEQEASMLELIDGGSSKAAAARQFGVSLIVVRRLLAERRGHKKTGLYPVLKKFL